MKILLSSPLGFPINPQTKYAGIERLVWEYSRELSKAHDVTVVGHAESIFPPAVKVLRYRPRPTDFDPELTAYQTYQSKFRSFDVIHDFSHLHLISRFMVNLPTLNIFWHAPALAKYPKAPYNIIALSQWAAREFKRIYHQDARFQQSIAIDPDVYKPVGERGNRFLTIGRMAPEKGNLRAILLCRDAGVPLDVVGGRGVEKSPNTPLSDYEKAIMGLCDGEKIKFWGEVTEEQKLSLMQQCKALLYATDHPEVTNHKVQECMFCGAPVIVPAIGAMPEIVTHGVDGFLCANDKDFKNAILHIDILHPEKTHDKVVQIYSIHTAVANYIPLYEQVRDGLRW